MQNFISRSKLINKISQGLSSEFIVFIIYKCLRISLVLSSKDNVESVLWKKWTVWIALLACKQSILQIVNWKYSMSIYIFHIISSSLASSVFHIWFLCSLASFLGSTIQRDSVEGKWVCDSEFSESSPCRNLAEDRISSSDAKFSGPRPDANFECMAHITLCLD